jgi:hypothetical protein
MAQGVKMSNDLSPEDQEAYKSGLEKMARSTKDKRPQFNIWRCLECEGQPEMEHGEFVKHIREVHNIQPDTSGTQTMTMHLDGRDWYQSNYAVTFNGLKFENYVRNKRGRSTRIY